MESAIKINILLILFIIILVLKVSNKKENFNNINYVVPMYYSQNCFENAQGKLYCNNNGYYNFLWKYPTRYINSYDFRDYIRY